MDLHFEKATLIVMWTVDYKAHEWMPLKHCETKVKRNLKRVIKGNRSLVILQKKIYRILSKAVIEHYCGSITLDKLLNQNGLKEERYEWEEKQE